MPLHYPSVRQLSWCCCCCSVGSPNWWCLKLPHVLPFFSFCCLLCTVVNVLKVDSIFRKEIINLLYLDAIEMVEHYAIVVRNILKDDQVYTAKKRAVGVS